MFLHLFPLERPGPVGGRVYIRKDLTRKDHVETPYYSSEAFPAVYVQCGTDKDFIKGDEASGACANNLPRLFHHSAKFLYENVSISRPVLH